jgi:hypothetical protein
MYKYLLLLVLFVNSLAGFAQPANDNCNNAINIPVAAAGVTCTSPVYTNTNATTEAYTSPSCWNTHQIIMYGSHLQPQPLVQL